MSLLEKSKSCHTCIKGDIVDKHTVSCDIIPRCIQVGEYKPHWVMCISCKTCTNRDGSVVNYLIVCKPCYLNGFVNWKGGDVDLIDDVIFKVSY